eukprot:CAMPEP_0175810992 /NCGR_PEP_ID=MMETSP0107_2-20121207/3616_1 /TAXON_ID=195067 ORGANISM="Goniomonas pacifica, Strain CCMP1869" /NCGR_SAMPLE_ID=MMETSP0107_2 /ASSEMBLY_ACC=CAM_ASM_000203 /LENGTH=133 /DNA_ID=CAMNT_0017122779 /DNA_START=110 /DNA_END=508 /DNA_ORIENTATION=+
MADLRLLDGGFFGGGIYLTPQAQYACRYAMGEFAHAVPPSGTECSVLLCYTVVSNVYPVTRGADYVNPDGTPSRVSRFHCDFPIGSQRTDKALMGGYDCHVACVAPPHFEVVEPNVCEAVELVVKEERQVLPW